jgi:hypothetical protein
MWSGIFVTTQPTNILLGIDPLTDENISKQILYWGVHTGARF